MKTTVPLHLPHLHLHLHLSLILVAKCKSSMAKLKTCGGQTHILVPT